MRYLMKQHFWGRTEKFTIKDEEGRDCYFFEGKRLSINNMMTMYDGDGTPLLTISRKLLSLKPLYEIRRGDEVYATVQKDLTFFKDKFTLDLPGPNDIEIKGNMRERKYNFHRQGRKVASVSKRIGLTDTYNVDIDDDQDAATLLATAVVIDMVSHDD